MSGKRDCPALPFQAYAYKPHRTAIAAIAPAPTRGNAVAAAAPVPGVVVTVDVLAGMTT
jgi:hypothetical protein